MPLINTKAVREQLVAEWNIRHAGNVNPKTRVAASAVARVNAAAKREIQKIAEASFGPGKTIR